MWRRTVVLVAAGFVLFVASPLFAQHCDRLAKASSKEFISFLETHSNPDEADGYCVAFSIGALKHDRNDPQAAAVLIKFLTFHYKDPSCELISGGRCMGKGYPATESLYHIGKVSIPLILEAIKSDSTSQLARENALDVYHLFVRYDVAEGIAALKQEADLTKDKKAREHLLWAASALAK